MPELVDLVVNLRVLLDIGIGRRNIGFRLIVIVVADEVFDRVIREELAKLREELSSESFVMAENQRRLVHLLNNVCHRVGFSGPGRTQKNLSSLAVPQAANQCLDGSRLIAGRLKW